MPAHANDRYIYLADQPELLPTLADWFYNEWGRNDPDSSREKISTTLGQYLNRDHIPLTIVRLRGSQPIASASLKIREMETHPQYTHWLGGVYVHPDFRKQGIGSHLVEYSAELAKKLKVCHLYLYTRNHENFYTRLDWQEIERPTYQGRNTIIMKKNLSVGY
ncbi:MAG: GNAT family N-acetyltransferase [Anaerolineales bacterium]|jgi:GNAT superfamily N-acetyltransferase